MLKFLGIGLHRTGTRSISTALNILGYRSLHGGTKLNCALVNNRIDYNFIDQYDAIFDGFCCLKYRTLDKHYDDLKFIYSVRDLDSWLSSCTRYSHYTEVITKKAVFGSFKFDKEIWTNSYKLHAKNVDDYFKGRNEDVLVLDIKSNNKWEQLCNFVGKDIPNVEFPWKGQRRK